MEATLPTFIYSIVGIAMCLTFIAILDWYKKRHPNLFTAKATWQEKVRFNQITKTAMNIMLIYLVFYIFALTLISYKTPPIAIIVLCGIFVIFAISNIITTFKKK